MPLRGFGDSPGSLLAAPSPRAVPAQTQQRGTGVPRGSQRMGWGVLAISPLPAHRFDETCRPPRDPNPEQENGCHHDGQASLSSWLLSICSAAGPRARLSALRSPRALQSSRRDAQLHRQPRGSSQTTTHPHPSIPLASRRWFGTGA